ncbi:uncharacterized protein [Haliotis cracherodii]|uniref:uncharacterized protein n=1 Tax=Haliotis cracherodii TaxID=6455 RepID=UPI0039E98D0F
MSSSPEPNQTESKASLPEAHPHRPVHPLQLQPSPWDYDWHHLHPHQTSYQPFFCCSKTEIEHLRQIFTQFNNYPPNLVSATLKPESAPFLIALPVTGKASHIISRLLKQQANIDTHFTSSNSLNSLANGRHTTKPKEPKGVVYKIDCNCGQSHVGETPRPINTRIKVHKTSTIKSDSKSAILDHISNCPNHNINWDNVQILSNNLHDFTKRKLKEAVNIRRHKP